MSIPTLNSISNAPGKPTIGKPLIRTRPKSRTAQEACSDNDVYMSSKPALQLPARRVSAGVDIVTEGDEVPPYLLILDGWAAPLKSLCDGRQQFFDILVGPDGLRGLRSSHDAHASLSVVALTDCSVWQGTIDDLRLLNGISGIPDFARCQQIFMDQHQRMLSRMALLGHSRAPERVAYCLLELWTRQLGHEAVAGASCPLPIKQCDIGDAVGLTGVHVCRTLSTFKKLGIVRIEEGRMTVLRPADLADIACTDLLTFVPDQSRSTQPG